MRMCWSTCFLVFLAGACGKRDKTKEESPPAPTASLVSTPTAECNAKVAELATWMKTVQDEGMPVPPNRELQLVMVDRAPTPMPHLRQVKIRVDGISFDRMSPVNSDAFVEFADALRTHRKETDDERDRRGDRPRDELLVLIDEKASWELVARVANATRTAGYKRLHFPLEAKSRVAPPPHSSITEELRGRFNMDPWSKAPLLSDEVVPLGSGLAKVYTTCAPVMALLGGLGDLSASERENRIVAGMPKAIASCECEIDIAAVKTLHWSYYERFNRPPTTLISIDLGDDKARSIRHKAATPWSEVFKSLADLEYPIKLEADR